MNETWSDAVCLFVFAAACKPPQHMLAPTHYQEAIEAAPLAHCLLSFRSVMGHHAAGTLPALCPHCTCAHPTAPSKHKDDSDTRLCMYACLYVCMYVCVSCM